MKRLALFSLLFASVFAFADDDDIYGRRLIVRLKPGVSPLAIAAKYNLTYRDGAWPFANFEAADPNSASVTQVLMQSDPNLLWAEGDEESESPENTGGGRGGTIPTVATDPVLRQQNQTALANIGYPLQGSGLEAAREIKVAVLDTGLSNSVASLKSRVLGWFNTIDGGNAFDAPRQQDSNGDGRKDGAVGHGTMVTGIIAQMAPSARFFVIRALNSDGYGSAWSIVKGLVIAVNRGAEVANLSFGSRTNVTALNDVLDWAVEEKGLHVIAAVGNDGSDQAFAPADVSKVISVAGLATGNRKSTFSNWNGKVDVSAPSLSVKSYNTNARIATWSGTSFSTPLVTGGIVHALARTKGKVTPDQMDDALKLTGLNVDPYNEPYKGKLGVKLQVGTLGNYLSARF